MEVIKMYDKIQNKMYIGPAGQEESVKNILRANKVPDHSASVYEQNHDTGYPGLAITSTYVNLHLNDEGLAKKVDELLLTIGFRQNR